MLRLVNIVHMAGGQVVMTELFQEECSGAKPRRVN